jgi:hypothetical protein
MRPVKALSRRWQEQVGFFLAMAGLPSVRRSGVSRG